MRLDWIGGVLVVVFRASARRSGSMLRSCEQRHLEERDVDGDEADVER